MIAPQHLPISNAIHHLLAKAGESPLTIIDAKDAASRLLVAHPECHLPADAIAEAIAQESVRYPGIGLVLDINKPPNE